LLHPLAEALVGLLAAGRADDGEAVGEEPADGEGVERRHQLALGEVAGGAEDDERARLRPPPQVQPGEERIVLEQRGHARVSPCRTSPSCAARTAWPPNWLRSAAFTFAANDAGCREA